MPTCVNYWKGYFRLYSSIVDQYVTGPLTEEEVMMYEEVTSDRVARAKANGCSYFPEAIRCEPGKNLIRKSNIELVPEDPSEWNR